MESDDRLFFEAEAESQSLLHQGLEASGHAAGPAGRRGHYVSIPSSSGVGSKRITMMECKDRLLFESQSLLHQGLEASRLLSKTNLT